MQDPRPRNLRILAVAWFFMLLFVLGFFISGIGAWTGPVVGAWFVGTQRPWRGFQWMVALGFIPSLVFHFASLPHGGLGESAQSLVWLLAATILSVLPYTIHRLIAPRLSGWRAALPLPFAAVGVQVIALALLPGAFYRIFFFPPDGHASRFLLDNAAQVGIGAVPFAHLWLASFLVWMWNLEFRGKRIAAGAGVFAAVSAAMAGWSVWMQVRHEALATPLPTGGAFASCSALILIGLFAMRAPQPRWLGRRESMARLRSPYTGEPLGLVEEAGQEFLASESGERFPIRKGIPVLLRRGEITGANRKYNLLYETIAGFYDDTQRVALALAGMDRDAYVRSYLKRLEAKPGDAVLETSVGTGLNFKYLPQGARLTGLDLSAEMLANCQTNLRRWEMEADLYLGNAETLPFADNSFDVVFHTGGINFFSDRAKAIGEMIRVAKPGSLILIADETEEHVQKAYENIPYTREFYKSRTETVAAPVNLLPEGMEEVNVEIVWGNRFYALTFRKPRRVSTDSLPMGEAGAKQNRIAAAVV
jgi:ubiquinone/menaquinone biosynthesis C-methylase UbiE